MKQQVPVWAIIAGVIAALAIIGFIISKMMASSDGPGSSGGDERAKHMGGGQGAPSGPNAPRGPGGQGRAGQ
jgi:hypothetical protein